MAGVLLAGSLALAACGSDDNDAATDTSAAVTGTATSAAQGSGSAAPSGALDPLTSAAPGDPSAPADPADPAASGDPAAPADPADPAAPAAPGDPAAAPSGDDAQQITDLIKGLNGDMTVADFMQYTVDHSCTSYLDAKGGRDAQQQQIDALRESAGDATQGNMANDVTDVTDISVNGDSATATARGTIQGETDASQPVQLQRENGAWTICPAA